MTSGELPIEMAMLLHKCFKCRTANPYLYTLLSLLLQIFFIKVKLLFTVTLRSQLNSDDIIWKHNITTRQTAIEIST